MCFGIVGLLSASVHAGTPGSRPRDVAISSDGKAILTTSEGSNQVVIKDHGNTTYLTIDTDPEATTWGACFVELAKAVVTVPTRRSLAVVEWTGTAWTATEVGDIGYYLTEVIPSPTPGRVLVASRGPSAGSWQHAVYEVNYTTGAITKTFITERQPRALAMSPDNTVLYVATALGALGGAGITANHAFVDDPTPLPLDGGSIVSYNYGTQTPRDRFPIGSPVRGLAVWNGTNQHRLYFTHLGGGAQGEAPELGGRLIPNVVASILFNGSNNPVSKVEAVLGHDPDAEASAQNPAAILPDRLAIRPGTPTELWVTNSASGSVSCLGLDMVNGFNLKDPSFDLNLRVFNLNDTGLSSPAVFEVMTARNADLSPFMENATGGKMRLKFRIIDNPITLLIDSSANPPSPPFSSNPRGILYDPTHDRLLAVTRFDQELVEIDGSTKTVTSQVSLLNGTATIPTDERNFFTFGEGFDFREALGAAKTNTLACASCHVDGHIDAKIHKTPISKTFINSAPENAVEAVPPSVFDVGNTEWIFLDGQSTILDDEGTCDYCVSQRFFADTTDFTGTARSPRSPHADQSPSGPDDVLTAAELNGRAWFDELNCSRCHSGTADSFFRSTEPGLTQKTGPLTSNSLASRLLNDPTQVFVANCPNGDCTGIEGGASIKNMTDVGTRPARGANTPALAGAWDNAPYFHDGRYRDLDEVLEDTWLKSYNNAPCEVGYFAAPLWECVDVDGPAVTVPVPDNFANAFDHYTDDSQVDQVVGHVPLLFPFRTHDETKPSGTVSVKNYFQNTIGDMAAYEDLKLFLLSLSSYTDPCSGDPLQISGIGDSYNPADGITTITWTTSYPVSCSGFYGPVGQVVTAFKTPVGVSHSLPIEGLCLGTQYQIDIDADRRRGVCDAESDNDSYLWTNAGTLAISNLQQAPEIDCSENVVSWNTNVAVSCTLEWGFFGQGYPNSLTTAAGVSHQKTIPTVPHKKYQARVIASCDTQSDTEYFNWSTKICGSTKPGEPATSDGILAVSPTPFNPSTTVTYGMLSSGTADLRVYNVAGRLVRTLVNQRLDAGTHEVTWDGRSDTGTRVATGIYYLRLITGETRTTRKIVLVE